MAYLQAGTSILPHAQSKRFMSMIDTLPHHANGVWGTITDVIGDATKWIKNTVGDVGKFIAGGASGAWKWISEKMGLDKWKASQQWSAMNDMASGTVGRLKDSFLGKFTSLFKKKQDEDSAGSGPMKSLPELESVARQAAKIMHVDPSDSFIRALANVAMSESGGNAGAANNWDVNAQAGMASVGLLQYIPSTWSYYNVPGHNNRSSVLDNFVHFFNNSDWKNSIGYVTYPSWHGAYKWDWKHNGPIGAPRMAMGGRYTKETPAVIGEDGTEYVVNVTKENADELLAAAITERAQTRPESVFAQAMRGKDATQASVSLASGMDTSVASSLLQHGGNGQGKLLADVKDLLSNVTFNLQGYFDPDSSAKVMAPYTNKHIEALKASQKLISRATYKESGVTIVDSK
jgi:SLT domain-containing protein